MHCITRDCRMHFEDFTLKEHFVHKGGHAYEYGSICSNQKHEPVRIGDEV